MPTFELSFASPAEVAADLLILPFYQGRVVGPGLAAVQKALGADLLETLAEHRATGKVGESFARIGFRVRSRQPDTMWRTDSGSAPNSRPPAAVLGQESDPEQRLLKAPGSQTPSRS